MSNQKQNNQIPAVVADEGAMAGPDREASPDTVMNKSIQEVAIQEK